MSAGTLSSIANVEELLDVRQPQAHALCSADEAESLCLFVAVEAVAGGSPRGRTQQTKALVVPQRVRAEPQRRCLCRDRLRHGSEGKPWCRLQGQGFVRHRLTARWPRGQEGYGRPNALAHGEASRPC